MVADITNGVIFPPISYLILANSSLNGEQNIVKFTYLFVSSLVLGIELLVLILVIIEINNHMAM